VVVVEGVGVGIVEQVLHVVIEIIESIFVFDETLSSSLS
jgi:hypothetical protein